MPIQPSPNTALAIDYRVIVTVSLLLSLWLILIDPVLDRDAILYLRAADAYLQDGLGASQQLFDRPALSICLAWVHRLTGLPLPYAGLLVNSLFYALFCLAFVSTVSALGGDRRVQLFAAAVALFHPTLNDQRSSILRDPAFWALALLAFRQLLLYAQQPGLGRRLRWWMYILLASLFRFEGLFFAALAPISLLAVRELPHRFRHCLGLLAPALLLLGVAAALLPFYGDGSSGVQLPGNALYWERLLHFPQQFSDLAASAGTVILNPFSRDDAAVALLAGLAAIATLNICRALTWPLVLLFVWQWPKRDRLRRDSRILLQSHLGICLLYLGLFTLLNHFMTERYATQLVVFILLYLPFMLERMWRADSGALPRCVAVAVLLFMIGDSLHNRDHEKAFIRDARDWVLAHTPPEASLVSNNEYLAYFSRRQFDWKVATYHRFQLQNLLEVDRNWRDRDYLVMRLTRHNEEIWEAFLQRESLEEIMVFDGGRHGRVAIVKLPAVAQVPADDKQL